MAIHPTVVEIFQSGPKCWIDRQTNAAVPRATLLAWSPQSRLNLQTVIPSLLKACLWSYLSPCGHCVCVIYWAELRQPSGPFLELICFTAVCICVRESAKDREGGGRKAVEDRWTRREGQTCCTEPAVILMVPVWLSESLTEKSWELNAHLQGHSRSGKSITHNNSKRLVSQVTPGERTILSGWVRVHKQNGH